MWTKFPLNTHFILYNNNNNIAFLFCAFHIVSMCFTTDGGLFRAAYDRCLHHNALRAYQKSGTLDACIVFIHLFSISQGFWVAWPMRYISFWVNRNGNQSKDLSILRTVLSRVVPEQQPRWHKTATLLI
ncbi:MAG: hypothetical protein DSY43_00010 [Gammaproteobacteria bacterium]|nr:MAG: hypothetical protein DSY43_00010 [Gammaproteobacteria bacterium]